MPRLLRHLLLLAQLGLAGFWWFVVKPDLREDWPAMLAGVAIAAFPIVVAYGWLKYRGDRVGKL